MIWGFSKKNTLLLENFVHTSNCFLIDIKQFIFKWLDNGGSQKLFSWNVIKGPCDHNLGHTCPETIGLFYSVRAIILPSLKALGQFKLTNWRVFIDFNNSRTITVQVPQWNWLVINLPLYVMALKIIIKFDVDQMRTPWQREQAKLIWTIFDDSKAITLKSAQRDWVY